MTEQAPTLEATPSRQLITKDEAKNLGYNVFWGVLGGGLGGLTLDAIRNDTTNTQHANLSGAIEHAQANAGTTRDAIDTLKEEFPPVPEAIAAAETRLADKQSGIQAQQAQRETLPPDATQKYMFEGAGIGACAMLMVGVSVMAVKRMAKK